MRPPPVPLSCRFPLRKRSESGLIAWATLILMTLVLLLAPGPGIYAGDPCANADYYLRVNGQPIGDPGYPADWVATVTAGEVVTFKTFWDIWIARDNYHTDSIKWEGIGVFIFGDGTEKRVPWSMAVWKYELPDDKTYDSITLCVQHTYTSPGDYPVEFYFAPESTSTSCDYLGRCSTAALGYKGNHRGGTVKVKPSTNPDLVVLGFTDPPPYILIGGDLFIEEVTIKNQGAVKAEASQTSYYLSHERCGKDILLDSHPEDPLEPGEKRTRAGPRLEMHSSIPVGKYYVSVFADGPDQIKEANEDNNCLSSTNTVRVDICSVADLTPLDQLSQQHGDPGGELTASYFDQHAHANGGKPPLFSLASPYVDAQLDSAVQELQRQLEPLFGFPPTRESGYRPPGYQAHLREIVDKLPALEEAVKTEPSCQDRLNKVSDEKKVHGLGTKVGQPGKSRHQAFPAAAVDVGPEDLMERFGAEVDRKIGELCQQGYQLSRPLGNADAVHLEILCKMKPVQDLRVVAASPINLLVTDPLNRRAGFTDGQAINEIGATATYSGPDTEPQLITIEEAMPGSYTVAGIGTGDGPYTITVERTSEDGAVLGSQRTTGMAATGQPLALMTVKVPETLTGGHDLAITKLIAPKTILLTRNAPAKTKQVTVEVQNRGWHPETILDRTALAKLVKLEIASLGNCPGPVPVLHEGPAQPALPVTLESKATLTVVFDISFDCANDPARNRLVSVGHEDYRYTASVDHTALEGHEDVHPSNDFCPRSVTPPFVVEPYPDGTIEDPGCGAPKPDGTFGGDVVTDVVRWR